MADWKRRLANESAPGNSSFRTEDLPGIRSARQPRNAALTWLPPLLFSVLYFVDVIVRATEKYFWSDELVTLDICRLPLHSLWPALSHGLDFNPLLFYLISKTSRVVFGESLVGFRVPEMIGFWIVCLCLYRFVNRRAGWLAGSIAMVMPVVTGVFFYAYEARPHALVLACGALALVCWQMTLEQPRSRLWLAGFSTSLFLAGLLHTYAVLLVLPFAIFELVRTVQLRRINWVMWTAIVLPAFF